MAFAAADGSRLAGWWIAPRRDAPVVLIAHGRSGNIATRAAAAQRLGADGFGVMLFDYRGYGASGGRPSERGLTEDAVSAYEWLRRRGVPANRIALPGHSLGNAPAAALAASRQVVALVLVSPFETTGSRLSSPPT